MKKDYDFPCFLHFTIGWWKFCYEVYSTDVSSGQRSQVCHLSDFLGTLKILWSELQIYISYINCIAISEKDWGLS